MKQFATSLLIPECTSQQNIELSYFKKWSITIMVEMVKIGFILAQKKYLYAREVNALSLQLCVYSCSIVHVSCISHVAAHYS